MHDDNRFGSRRDTMLDVTRIDAEGLGIDISENRCSTKTVRLRDRGPVSDAWTDHFIAEADAQAVHSTQDGCRAVVVSQAVFSAEHLGVLFLEFSRYFDTGHLFGAQHIQYGLFVPLCNNGPCEKVRPLRFNEFFAAQ